MKIVIITNLFIIISLSAISQSDSLQKDSVVTQLSIGIHSHPYAALTGAKFSENDNGDMRFIASYKNFTFFSMKAVDFTTWHSGGNFFYSDISYNWKLTERFSIIPMMGYYTPQSKSVIQEKDDALIGGFSASYQLNKNISISSTGYYFIWYVPESRNMVWRSTLSKNWKGGLNTKLRSWHNFGSTVSEPALTMGVEINLPSVAVGFANVAIGVVGNLNVTDRFNGITTGSDVIMLSSKWGLW